MKLIVELSNQIKKRFNFDVNGGIAKLNVLDPKVAQAPDISPVSLIPLAVHFPSIIAEDKLNDLDDQWRSYRLLKDITLVLTNNNIPEYWYQL